MATRLYPMPKSDFTFSSGFGPREGGYHYGLDFAAKDGTKFYAVQAGTVQYIGSADGYGQWIVIDSDDSEGSGCVEYGHMWNAFSTGLKVGDHVSAGQHIGYVGSNGQSSGPHLHITVWAYGYGGTRIDPAAWLLGSGYPGAAATTGGTVANKPAFTEVTRFGGNYQSRNGARVPYALGHTEEGNSTALNLATAGNNGNTFSYHDIIDNTHLVHMVPKASASWSVGDANARTLNYCIAGSRAAWTRQQWIDNRRNAIRILAWQIVQDAKSFPYLKLQGNFRPYPLGNVPCVSDHYFVTKVLGWGNHTDLGPNFPTDLLMADIRLYSTGASTPAAAENKINVEAKRAAAWIGKRLDPTGATAENSCPDGKGRWVKFEGGYIYWHPLTGAHAIPNYIFETWADLGFEAAKGLGYPIGDHKVIDGCEYQDFERGRIIRKGHPNDPHPGFFVTGDIRQKWYRHGSELGDEYGYPIANEIAAPSGDRYQDFEHGRIVWSAERATGITPGDGADTVK